MAEESLPSVKIRCTECGAGLRNHAVRASYEESGENEDMQWWQTFQVCKCLGCETVRFRRVTTCSEDVDWETGKNNPSVEIFPDTDEVGRQPLEMNSLPERVDNIYRETIKALNAGALTLAGGGLRAIVEAICLAQGVSGSNLQIRIDQLVACELLAKAQAELLHEERYIGNDALHEIEAPSRADIEDGLHIVESLLNTIYVAPTKARRLKGQRLKKKSEKSKSGPAIPETDEWAQ